MAIFTFKFDESYNSRTLVVAGWMAEERRWHKVKTRWLKALAYENRTLPEGRKLSRYHAANMNAHDYEFQGWKEEPYRSLRLTRNLFKIVGNEFMTAAAIGLDLKAFDDFFPNRAPSGLCIPYIICMQLLMSEIATALEAENYPVDCRVALVQDHGDWDNDALRAYNQLVEDPNWEHRKRFVSITPLTWRDDVGLQSADMVAYEAMRLIDDTLWTGNDMRTAMKELLKKNPRVFAMYLDRGAIAKMREFVDEKHLMPQDLSVKEIRSSYDHSSRDSSLGD